jgi:hypothetical protein
MDSERKLIQHALGIDFGTSNSYFSDVRVGGIQLSYTDLKFHNGQSSVPTCILYKKQNNNGELPQVIDAPSSDAHPALLEHWNPCAFGAAAIELWKDLLDEERPHYHFRGGFKPDIAFTRQSYIDAVNFFRCTRQYLIDQRLITHFTPENGRQVVVGIPAKNIDGQEQKTLQALEDAGIFDAVLIPEPEGALFYHLYYDRNRITIEHAHHGVIVVDFGGGTFDLAYLRDGEVQTNWGNPMLGGRLFDDLFYQWFLEQQEGEKTRRKMISDGTLSFLRTFGFRRLKERFSSAWQNGQIARFRTRITVGVDFDYGVFRNVTIEQFMQRAQSYRPSYDLLLDLELLQDEYAKLLRGESIDLIGQVREQLLQAQEFIQKAAHSPLSAVILTGGSCRWPFMVDITQQIYPQAEIFQSPDPEATISRGLALCFAYREYAKDIGTSLQLDQPSLRRQLLEALSTSYQNFVRRITERFTSELYHGIIKPIFQGWRDKGGSIAHLEHSTRQATQSYFENDGRKAIEREHLLLQENVEKLFHDRIFAWLRQHHITRVEYLSLEYLEEFSTTTLTSTLVYPALWMISSTPPNYYSPV